MQPSALLAHAGRLLAGTPDEADIRRSVSAFYYAVFNLLTIEAAVAFGGPIGSRLSGAIRRSIDHRSIARVCQGVLSEGRARPKWLSDIMPASIPSDLLELCRLFLDLQAARLDADYDLETPVGPQIALSCQALADSAFEAWATVRTDPATHTFLAATALADRLTRRG